MNIMYCCDPMVSCYDNDNSAFVPEIWAHAGLEILEENMVASRLVHRDFEDEVRNFGDVVNTRRPGEFTPKRRKDGENYQVQDAVATNVRVPLDQWFYTTFRIMDGEQSLSFQDLVQQHLVPAVQNMARSIDRAVLGQIHRFARTPDFRAGRLNNLIAATSHEAVIDADTALTMGKAPQNGRSLVIHPKTQASLLKNDLFMRADKRGDGGNALENATLGRIFNFNTYQDMNVNYVSEAAADSASPASTSGENAAGTTGAIGISGTWDPTVGEFVNIEGNDQPTYITAAVQDTSITLNEPLKYAVESGAKITHYNHLDVDHASAGTYPAGHSDHIGLDGYTSGRHPQVGQLIAFGTHGSTRRTYTIIDVIVKTATSCEVLLDRPLEVSVADDAEGYPGPSGAMNWALTRNALALVTRPLAQPMQAGGSVLSFVASYNDLSLRLNAQYDIKAGSTQVNIDMLAGLALLDERLAVMFLG